MHPSPPFSGFSSHAMFRPRVRIVPAPSSSRPDRLLRHTARDGGGKLPGNCLEKGTNDPVDTTQDAPKVGNVVTAKGTLIKDKDFGAGYKYRVPGRR